MKSKPRHSDLTKRTSYLMGYVVGYLYPSDGLEWLCCTDILPRMNSWGSYNLRRPIILKIQNYYLVLTNKRQSTKRLITFLYRECQTPHYVQLLFNNQTIHKYFSVFDFGLNCINFTHNQKFLVMKPSINIPKNSGRFTFLRITIIQESMKNILATLLQRLRIHPTTEARGLSARKIRKPEYHPLAHKIEATAKALAEKLSLTSAWQVFYRPYLYATDNPKYAKGLQIWTGVMKKTFVGKPNLLTKAQPCDIVSPT